MQEVFEAEKRCNAIEDDTRRIQLSAAELLRACHDEKVRTAFRNSVLAVALTFAADCSF
jgi:hypothetical protein